MKAGGSKQKGADYERGICKALSLWVSGGEREDLYWRSAMSGGRATIGQRAGKDLAHQAGDITATHPWGHVLTDHFFVECKRYQDLNFGAFLTKGKGPLAQFWSTAIVEAVKHDRVPMLIVRQDFGDTLMMVPCEAMLTRGLMGHQYNFNPHAWLARLMRFKLDIYEFDLVVQKAFEPPAKYSLGSMLKPGELARIQAQPAATPILDSIVHAEVIKGKERSKNKRPRLIEDVTDAVVEDRVAVALRKAISRSMAGTIARAQPYDGNADDQD